MHRSELITFGAAVSEADRQVIVGRTERVLDATAPAGWRFEELERVFSVTYRPRSVWMVDTRHLVVAGVSDAGKTVIESWSLPAEQGAYRVEREPLGGPTGSPLAKSTLTFFDAGSGYVEPSLRAVVPPRRRLIHRGSEIDGVKWIVPDQEMRYVVVMDDAHDLWQVDFSHEGTPSVATRLIDAESQSFLLRVGSARMRQHTHEGRKLVLYPDIELSGVKALGVLHDAHNDGAFEGFDVLSYSAAKASDHWDSAWADDFVSRRFFEVDPRF